MVVTFEDGGRHLLRAAAHQRAADDGRDASRNSATGNGPVSTGLGEVFHYIVLPTGEKPSTLTEMRTAQDWTMRPALRTVPGTAEINSWGGLNKQYQVLFRPESLVKYGLTFQQVLEAIRSNNLNVGGGQMNRGGEMLLVHGWPERSNMDQLRDIVITARDGVPIHVGTWRK